MKVFISDRGDPSVGISPNVMTIEWNVNYPDKHSREDERDAFVAFVKELDFIKPDVVFGDECSECGAVVGEDLECLECKRRAVIHGL